MTKQFLAIDPGQAGAFVYLDVNGNFDFHLMPLKTDGTKDLDFKAALSILERYPGAHVLLERAHAGAMGVTGAFNYGRGFAALEIAIQISGLAVTYLEPSKWTRTMHEGISKDLKPKAKSVIAIERLYPQFLSDIPKSKNGKLHEGVVDALLIAGFGLRTSGLSATLTPNDF